MEAVQLAKRVLAADGQPFAILSLAQGFAPVTAETPVREARRSYMRLAGAIHPDRLQGSFDKATEAFQCLVRAFECFADPKLRKQAAAAAQRQRKAEAARPPSDKAGPSGSRELKKKREKAKPKSNAAPALKKQRRPPGSKEEEDAGADLSSGEDRETEDGASESSATDEEAWEQWAAAKKEPEVSSNRTPIGHPRVGGLYQPTTVGCPRCRSLWEPDSRPQYSLFMGHWCKKVHCQLCLFQFGCATALHGCPHCSTPFDYDVSMYDAVQTCQRCRKQFGFPYYPVSQHLIDLLALEEWRERMDREKANAREARARARHGGGSDEAIAAEEKRQLLLGTCIMEEECPLCHQRVKSKHRAHVEACMIKTPKELTKSTGKSAKLTTRAPQSADKIVKASVPRAAKATAKAAPKAPRAAVSRGTAAPPARRTISGPSTGKRTTSASQKRKRRRSDSDSSEEAESSSESKTDTISSESSFSADEDDSD
ncbi:hypothetical protein LSCM1_04266 [Leishmania martiniquensis]|uniref:J domain-containing protein n=1 Tax=Leishmania martiniquensis TaxID=1580590 RepID=A0A836GK47_9TRYP|nr:hypothetical protein LSCM1_04266 [Leishmania martiniquensis]